ncbi:MAG: tetratricopeptide repeat protein, partial [Betaproteobacteria bacterium]
MRHRPPKTRQVPSYLRKIAAPSGDVAANFQEALLLHQQGQLQRAAELYERILARQPTHSDSLHLLGVVAHQSGKPAVAVELISRSIEINPSLAAAYNNRGLALNDLKRLDQALASLDKAISLKPDYAEAYSNRGNALKDLKRLDEALASCDKAIALKPDFADANFGKSYALLLRGDMRQGLPLYEWRWKQKDCESLRRGFSEPLWLGDADLNGKTILL